MTTTTLPAWLTELAEDLRSRADEAGLNGNDDKRIALDEAVEVVGEALLPVVEKLRALAGQWDKDAAEAFECAGFDPDDEDAPIDPEESEDYGYGLAHRECAEQLRKALQ